MRFPRLLPVCAVPFAFWACGGDVVVDGPPSGSGGSGASSSAASPSTGAQGPDTAAVGPGPGPSQQSVGVTSGPGCDCNDACNKLLGCGYEVDCGLLCDRVDPQDQELIECVCAAPGCDVGGCGGPDPTSCLQCVHALPEGACPIPVQDCAKFPQCIELVECHLECGLEQPCTTACDNRFPEFQFLADDVLECAVCEQCLEPCQNTAAQAYCGSD